MTRLRVVLRHSALDRVDVVEAPLDLLTEHDLGLALAGVHVRPWPVEDLRDHRLAYQRPGSRAAAAMVAAGPASSRIA